jgi:uncharacterized membrane protein
MDKIRKFQIRYNTHSTSEETRWRLIEDGNEILVASIIIDGHTSTTKDWIAELNEYKWHVSCKGHCIIKDNIAYVTTVKKETVFLRHVLKTISYRLLGTLTTVLIAYGLGASMQLSSLLGVGELLIKPIIYFFHERIWYKYIRIKNNKNNN